MRVTRDGHAASVQNETGFPKKPPKDLVDSTMEPINGTLASGEDVLISGFGKFDLRDKSARKGRNPRPAGSHAGREEGGDIQGIPNRRGKNTHTRKGLIW